MHARVPRAEDDQLDRGARGAEGLRITPTIAAPIAAPTPFADSPSRNNLLIT